MAKPTAPKVPTHEVFHVVGDGEKAHWTKIGAGWRHQDGEGMNVVINTTPLAQGRIVIRSIKNQPEAE